MPVHWTRGRANRFHDFHQSWTVALSNALNARRLPAGYFAMVEQQVGGPEPDVITRTLKPPINPASPGGLAVEFHPPRASHVSRSDGVYNDDWARVPRASRVSRTEAAAYARKANRVTVRHPDGDVVTVIEVVSPGNKDSEHAICTLAYKAVALLQAGVHLLIVDLFPPGPQDPQGIHKEIWHRVGTEEFTLPPDRPLTLAAYTAGTPMMGYVEPVAVGGVLPDMPVFLTAQEYVPCPLEATYQTAWEQFPAPLKGPLESPPGA
jgi:hypothetical protein